jgi:hypothetical protein
LVNQKSKIKNQKSKIKNQKSKIKNQFKSNGIKILFLVIKVKVVNCIKIIGSNFYYFMPAILLFD